MKSILDTIREMDGAATPANTMGMGNPMPATDTTPGSEPICTKCKKKKKTVKESIFDTEEKIEKFDSTIVQSWIDTHTDSIGVKINKDLSIDANYISINLTEPIPDYIIFNNVSRLMYYCDFPIDDLYVPMPKKAKSIEIATYHTNEIYIVGDINCDVFKVSGDAMKIHLPKKIKCDTFDFRDSDAHRIEGLKNTKAGDICLPSNFLRVYLQETLKLAQGVNLYLRGSKL